MENTALATKENQTLIRTGTSMFFDVQMFEHMQRVASIFTKSTMVPDHFRGNLGNILIALNFAERIGADPFMCMQNMYVIHGKPGIEGKLVIALVNQCGRFEPLMFDESATHCIAYATEIKSGKTLKSPNVTMDMVKKEGWWDKKGSKWKTIPELMFRYRAATYFARTYCPEVLLGMQTTEELRDTIEMRVSDTGAYVQSDKVTDLNEKLKAKREQEAPPQVGQHVEPPETEKHEAQTKENSYRSRRNTMNVNGAEVKTCGITGEALEYIKEMRGVHPEETSKCIQATIKAVGVQDITFLREDEGEQLVKDIKDAIAASEATQDPEPPAEVNNASAPPPWEGEEQGQQEPEPQKTEYIHCPASGSRKAVGVCEQRCDKRDTCDSYGNYLKLKNPDLHTKECPNDGKPKLKSECDECPSQKEGCPEWMEPEQG